MQKYIIAAWSDKINLFFGFFQKNFSHIPRLSGKTSREVSLCTPRTDLAMEAKALYERSAQEQTQLSGVAAREQERHGVRMTVVKITSAEGEQALGKPRGTYITAELEALSRREPGSFSNAVRAAIEPGAARAAGAVQAGARRRAGQPGHHARRHRPGGREESDRHAPSAGGPG